MWAAQFSHVRAAFELAAAWKTHDVYVRARIDRRFDAPVPLPRIRRQVYAVINHHGWAAIRNVTIPRDWLYVSDAGGMRAITNTTSALTERTMRCFAAFPEERVALHIARAGYVIVPFVVRLDVVSKKNWCRAAS